MSGQDELIGKTFGPYTIVARLGEGGMAVVYKGFQESLNRYVAIKVLRAELARDEEFVTRFRREALSVAHLHHPNILHVYDAGAAHGWYYIAMDYAEGGSLKDLIARGPLAVDQAASIASQVAGALDLAHQQGLVHRDVKPHNILLTREGRPLLTDFGIAKALHESTHLTRTGTSIGTPEYMSPEQLQGQTVDGRTDIYALGIVLFEMLTGWAPFKAPTPVATMYKQVNDPPPSLRQVNATVPAWLEAVANKALAKRPEDRYQRASEMAEALRMQRAPGVPAVPRVGADRAPARVPPVADQREEKRRPAGKVPILVGAIAVLLLVLLAGGAYLVLGGLGREPTPEASPTAVVIVVTSAPEETPVPTLIPTRTPRVATPRPATPTPPPTALPKTPTPVPTATREWRVLISDQFDDNQKKWPMGPDTNDYVTNNWSLVDGTYQWDAQAHKGVNWYVYPSMSAVKDQEVSVQAKQVSGSGGYRRCGLVLRMVDSANFYFLGLSNSQEFAFLRKYNGTWERLINWKKESAIRAGQANTITVRAEGSRFSLIINGKVVGKLSDDAIGQGKAAMAIDMEAGAKMVCQFDDFQVRVP
jgi:predicted Ser/Thr protein kinase